MAHDHSSMSHDMGGMDHSMGGCKVNMLWNWYTIDACFLSEDWRITSSGMFAGSCIGVILLVMLLEFFRRMGKEYDRFLIRQYQRAYNMGDNSSGHSSDNIAAKGGVSAFASSTKAAPTFRPNVIQQVVRAALHMVQFAIAYIVMLLAMYYNGYIIICIFIGAFLGNFTFNWETITLSGPQEDPTLCCG